MTDAPHVISGLSAIAHRYEAIFCDVWGVIHNGQRNFPLACEALARVQAETGAPVILVSNAPRPSQDVKPQLRALLVPDAAWASFVTSGDATRAEIAKRAPGPVMTIGPEKDNAIYAGLTLDFAGPDQAAFISCTGLVDDDAETPADYRKLLAQAAARRLPMVCANPDRIIHRGEKLVYCAGALADLYLELGGGPVIMAGKPFQAIYDLALEEAARLLGRPVARDKVLAIGDGLPTDVAGAHAQGIDCLFIAGGIHGAETLDAEGQVIPQAVNTLLAEAGVGAAYVAPHLSW